MSEPSPSNDRAEFRSKIRAVVEAQFPAARHAAKNDTDSLLESGVVDSLGILEIVQFRSESFSIEVSDEDLLPENFESIECLVGFVESRQP